MDNKKKKKGCLKLRWGPREKYYTIQPERGLGMIGRPWPPCLSSLAGGKLITLLFWKLPIPICEVPCGAVYFCGLGLKAE